MGTLINILDDEDTNSYDLAIEETQDLFMQTFRVRILAPALNF